MSRRLIVFSIITVLVAPAAAAGPGYEFEPLPAAVDGVPLETPLAIANDGSVLIGAFSLNNLRYAIYRNGRLESFVDAPPPPTDQPIWTISDINTRHDVAGNNWYFRAPYSGYEGGGFIRDHRDSLVRVDSSADVSTRLSGINERGTAVGEQIVACPSEICGECVFEWCSPPVTTTAIVVVDGAIHPLALPDSGRFGESGAIAVDDAGRILGWRGARDEPRTHFLLDGRTFNAVPLPDGLTTPWAEFIDLNNRGQILGRASDPVTGETRSFIREPDGAFEPIEWTYPWPDALQVLADAGETVSLHLTRTMGTRARGFNDRGEVLASARALYEGLSSHGFRYSRIEEVHGVGSRR